MFYLGLLLLGSRGVRGECWAFLYGRRGEGSLLEQLPLPQQAGVHGSAAGKRRQKGVGVTKLSRSRNICLSQNMLRSMGPTGSHHRVQLLAEHAKDPTLGLGVLSKNSVICVRTDAVTTSLGSNLFLVCTSFSRIRPDLNNRVKVSVHCRNRKECERECQTSLHGQRRVGKPATSLTRDLHVHRQDGTKWQRGGPPETTGRRMPVPH